ncbi:MAG: hypothetical protein U9N04_01485 [Patescibacteria group bacterium]|nr:hypothetical protein [Patescibacteria group bacterium]
MKKISVSEYANSFNVSVQSVYQRIKRGSLKSVEENGIKYVLLDNDKVKSNLKPKVESDCKDLLKLVKSQHKEIKRLTKEITKAKNEEVQTLKAFIGEMKQLAAPVPKEEEIIEVKEKKKKKRKKKK